MRLLLIVPLLLYLRSTAHFAGVHESFPRAEYRLVQCLLNRDNKISISLQPGLLSHKAPLLSRSSLRLRAEAVLCYTKHEDYPSVPRSS